MKRTIYLKFLLGYAIFGIFSYVLIATYVPDMLTRYFVHEESSSLYQEAVLIADTYASKLYTSEISLETVKEQLNALTVFLDADIWILNPSGRMVLDSAHPVDIEEVQIVEGFDPAGVAGSYYVIGNFFDYFDTTKLTVMAPIMSNYQINGYVVIHSDYSSILDSCYSLQGAIYLCFGILFLLSLIILIFFTGFVYIPLRKITKATEQYATGNYHYELQPDSSDEIGYLASILSYMASEIARSEDDQKKFVANVSHDFRSPLTSIRGYLEAMLDGTIPPELHEKYLRIVLNETERLTKLTNGLLQLNNLNTKGLLLDKTHFGINKVIRDTAASFEGTCQKKNIKLQLLLTGDEMLVHADMGKIQQVLYNLLDNAIKFSHMDSNIKIETTEKKNKLHISVKDYGIGIPKDEIKLVWDRFYKSDASRGKDKKGTGLGLAITKEIMQSHGENINVISTQGAGSEFIFTLPISEKMEEM
ncbi:MAG: HAMP domain-containing histidine kinase [Lachnospiraceae bacterium]|nr:HAMP domain-containing histidine kinase [Lachnospiraceae bacterium]